MICSATADGLGGMLFGRFLVGTGMGVSPPVAALYITEVLDLIEFSDVVICYFALPCNILFSDLL